MQTIPNVLIKLAQLFGTEVKNRRLEIPAKFGTGYCTGYVFNEYLRIIIMNYKLTEDIIIENSYITPAKRMILFKFKNFIHRTTGTLQPDKQIKEPPSVFIITSCLSPDALTTIHTNTATINIEVDADYLNSLLESSKKSSVLQSLLQNNQPLLFEQMISPSLHAIMDNIMSEPVEETFELFFWKIKTEELVCRLLMELEKRDEKRVYALNSNDIQTIYKVKEKILERIDVPPIINELATYAHMSPTKLKRLFKQIFGDSIFSYYQGFRMKEAARLLKEEKLSVSEVGYTLGFTNLSHFSKVFYAHMGLKPKQFSRS